MDRPSYRDAWTHLKRRYLHCFNLMESICSTCLPNARVRVWSSESGKVEEGKKDENDEEEEEGEEEEENEEEWGFQGKAVHSSRKTPPIHFSFSLSQSESRKQFLCLRN